jgi:hypothetical protein
LYGDGTYVNLTAGELIDGCKFWHRSDMYSKTVLAKVPLRWEVGFHQTDTAAREIAIGPPSPFLALVHLHKADFHLALGHPRLSRARKWSQTDIEHGRGWQNRIDDVAKLRAYWTMDVNTGKPLEPGRLEPVAHGVNASASRTHLKIERD